MTEQSSSSQKSNLFLAGMNSDLDPSFIQEGQWSYSRNASKVTASGSLQTLSTESSNILCTLAPFPIMGAIHLYEDKWAIFSTDNTKSEIGWFDDSECSYIPLKNHEGVSMNQTNCLNFSTLHLIKGISKQNFDCTWEVYFADGNNPDRAVNMNKPQFVQTCTPPNPCIICTDTDQLDCQVIRLASLVDSPCIKVSKSRTGGTLLNGSYFAIISYTINDQVVTDYFPPSNVQPLFEHSNAAGSLDITFTDLDTTHFTEFQLVVVRTINQQVSAKKIGIYSTHTKEVFIDNISESLTSIPIEQIPIRNPVYEKSDAIYSVGDYSIRIAPVTKFDFNYQPLANRIGTKWISVQYPSTYYRAGGNNPSYMADEIYPFFIRWIYDTGDRSSSYHIPGRAFIQSRDGLSIPATDVITFGETYWEVVNTASVINYLNTPLADGGLIIAEGDMGYWESSEHYPDNRPDIWNSSFYPWTNLPGGQDLCGKPIRHHKMPDRLITDVSDPLGRMHHIDAGANHIRVIGVKFDNIRPPLDNLGNPIPGITGYEILRGSREGNKTVIAKGMLNNMRKYQLAQDPNGVFNGLYQNYPYNPLGTDPTLEDKEQEGGWTLLGGNNTGNLYDTSKVSQDIQTFHSPDTQFKHPFLSINELKTYGQLYGTALGNFEPVPNHPKEKLLGDLAFVLAAIVGLGEVMLALRGQRINKREGGGVNNIGWFAKVAKQNAIGGNTANWTYVGGSQTANSGGDRDEYMEGAPNDNADFNDGIAYGKAAKDESDAKMGDVYDPTTGTDPGAFTIGTILTMATGIPDPGDKDAYTKLRSMDAKPGLNYSYFTTEAEVGKFDYIPQSLRGVLGGIIIVSHYWTLGTDTALKLIEAIVPFEQYAYRYRSHGYYDHITGGLPGSTTGTRRYPIKEAVYLDTQRQSLGNFQINNLYRNQAVVLNTSKVIPFPSSLIIPADNTLTSIGQQGLLSNPTVPFNTSVNSHYAALIQRFRNQYGQLDSIQQLNIGCQFKIDPLQLSIDYNTSELFGGDTYITRYTEKNTFFYFYDWLQNQPDGYEYDYRKYYMITYPRFWADFTRYEAGEFIDAIFSLSNLTNPFSGLPNKKAALDGDSGSVFTNISNLLTQSIKFRIKDAYFYLFQSGVRDFYVESEVNTDLRDYGDVPEERFYDPYRYTDTFSLFDPKIIKSGNYFKYDYSLSISKLFTNFISWGNLQPRYYDPLVAETCYIRRPNRLIYSLPQNLENTKDYWKVYLANNYKDFVSEVSVIKPTAKNGAIILFKADSPILFQGVDSQPLDSKLLTPEGWKIMGEITVNDKIIGRDGNSYNILNIYEIGDKPIYKVTFTDGSVVRASDTHHWNVLQYQARAKANTSGYLRETTKSTLDLSYVYHKRDAILPPEPINFKPKKYIISPYTMGVLIADGCITQSTPAINMNEIEILDRVKLETGSKSKIIRHIDKRFGSIMYRMGLTVPGARRKGSNPFDNELRRYGLFGCNSYTKFIPEEYLFGSVDQRIDLLRGLMDCDGTISLTKGKMSYCTVCLRLAKDVVKLVESLGGSATICGYNKKNYSGNPIVEYRVRLKINTNPFFLFRKASRFQQRKKMVLRVIKKVEFDGIEKARCIKTDAPDQLYITDNYILTHNTLNTDLNTKITLGDGGLFSQPQQSLVNVDVSYEYGSCQDRLSVINTPFGLYYMCTNQGKIFRATDQLKDITYDGLKFWFKEYLPLRILVDFPEFDILDNPLSGVGCQSVYDNQIETVYFCKRDFQLKPELQGQVTYSGAGIFSYKALNYPLGDPAIFLDASFTVSFDPKAEKGGWISYHDWHPDLNIPSKNNFLTTQAEGIWRHNLIKDSYCNYYMKQYPFQVEYICPTSNVNTLRSIEYYLECYKYKSGGSLDRFHMLDFNFDKAIIYNTEQVSGILNMKLTPKNDPWGELLYPRVNLVPEWEILYSKEEQKIRIDTFFDITRDRGEFPPYAKQVIWNTEPNGYIRRLNPNNLNYSKEQLQQKKFRHYLTKVLLEKTNPGEFCMSIKAVQTKLLESIR